MYVQKQDSFQKQSPRQPRTKKSHTTQELYNLRIVLSLEYSTYIKHIIIDHQTLPHQSIPCLDTMAPQALRIAAPIGLLAIAATLTCADAFSHQQHQRPQLGSTPGLFAKSGGGGGFGAYSSSGNPSKGKASRGKSGRDIISALSDDDDPSKEKKDAKSASRTFVKADQDRLLNDLAARSARTIIGRAVATSPDYGTPDMDPFWSLLPSLISTKFPAATDEKLGRVAGMVEFSLGSRAQLGDDVISDPWRPHDELHAYMPGLGKTEPFLDTSRLELCKLLSENYEVITREYEVLLENRFDRKGKDRFQSVTSMNCKNFFTRIFQMIGSDHSCLA